MRAFHWETTRRGERPGDARVAFPLTLTLSQGERVAVRIHGRAKAANWVPEPPAVGRGRPGLLREVPAPLQGAKPEEGLPPRALPGAKFRWPSGPKNTCSGSAPAEPDREDFRSMGRVPLRAGGAPELSRGQRPRKRFPRCPCALEGSGKLPPTSLRKSVCRREVHGNGEGSQRTARPPEMIRTARERRLHR